jgi:hypothetical protein
MKKQQVRVYSAPAFSCPFLYRIQAVFEGFRFPVRQGDQDKVQAVSA